MSFCSNTSPEKKSLFISFFWCTFSWVFVFACLSFFFSIFPSSVLFLCVYKHFSFLFSFLSVFLCWSLSMYLFFCENFVWFDHRFSDLFIFSFYILSLLHKKKQCFFELFLLCNLFFSKETVSCLLVLQREECSFVVSLASCCLFLLKRNLQNKLFYLFLNLLFWTMSFFVSFFLISFATWSLQKCLFRLFMSSFRSSSFHLLSLFLSPLVFSFLSPFSDFLYF